jgi:hypothetical protein
MHSRDGRNLADGGYLSAGYRPDTYEALRESARADDFDLTLIRDGKVYSQTPGFYLQIVEGDGVLSRQGRCSRRRGIEHRETLGARCPDQRPITARKLGDEPLLLQEQRAGEMDRIGAPKRMIDDQPVDELEHPPIELDDHERRPVRLKPVSQRRVLVGGDEALPSPSRQHREPLRPRENGGRDRFGSDRPGAHSIGAHLREVHLRERARVDIQHAQRRSSSTISDALCPRAETVAPWNAPPRTGAAARTAPRAASSASTLPESVAGSAEIGTSAATGRPDRVITRRPPASTSWTSSDR